MTVIARRVAAIPRRTATESWDVVCELLASGDGAAHRELTAITGTAAMLITEEYTATEPIILSGTGPQVRIYTVHGDDALEADLDEETKLPFAATDGDWALSLPARGSDVGEAAEAMSHAPRISVRDADDTNKGRVATTSEAGVPVIDLTELERP